MEKGVFDKTKEDIQEPYRFQIDQEEQSQEEEFRNSSSELEATKKVDSADKRVIMKLEREDAEKEFICGVVEGFYGRPWTTDHRRELFSRMQKIYMNTYVYAPKDDLKHRAQWRDPYTPEEADHLHSLIQAAKQSNIRFVYALSPGIDITYSSLKEIGLIKKKLEQVSQLGCDAFALLFDDIEASMSEVDRGKFSSFAQAQVAVTNVVYEHLSQPVFLFCPTEYCESRAVPSLEDSEYLNLIGKKLLPKIEILWTGPRVISRILSPEHARRVASVLRRKPLIWDNLHANDYDNRRVYLGPYSGRPIKLKEEISGVVTNPNCEFEANFVAMYTLADWANCAADANVEDGTDATLEAGGVEPVAEQVTMRAAPTKLYHPLKSLSETLDKWLAEFALPKTAFGGAIPVKPPAGLMLGITTCSSVTTTTCSSSSGLICGNHMATTPATVSTPTTTGIMGPPPSGLYQSGSAPPSPRSLPLYTPPAIADAIKDPFFPPPLVVEDGRTNVDSEATTTLTSNTPVYTEGDSVVREKQRQEHENYDPLLTPQMQAINSLTDEYSEPMELAVPSGSNSLMGSPASNDNALSSRTAAPMHHVHASSADTGTELMEAKSCDDLTLMNPNQPLGAPSLPNQPLGGASFVSSDLRQTDSNIANPTADGLKALHTSSNYSNPENSAKLSQSSSGINPELPVTIGNDEHDLAQEEQMVVEDHSESEENLENIHKSDAFPEKEDKIPICSEAPMQIDRDEGIGDEGKGSEGFMDTHCNLISKSQLQLMAEFFYLPFENGATANRLLSQFQWLYNNAAVVKASLDSGKQIQGAEWLRRAEDFGSICDDVRCLYMKLADSPNRGLVFALYPYVWEVQTIISILDVFVKWLKTGALLSKLQDLNVCIPMQESVSGLKEAEEGGIQSEASGVHDEKETADEQGEVEGAGAPIPDCEPWVFRGGIVGELQNMIPIHSGRDLFARRPPHPPTRETFVLRLAQPSDKDHIYGLHRMTFDDNMDASKQFEEFPDLIGDRYAGGFLNLSPEYCFVVEQVGCEINPLHPVTGNIVCVAMGTRDAKHYRESCSQSYIEAMKLKYPQPTLQDLSTGGGVFSSSSESSRLSPSMEHQTLPSPNDLIKSIHSWNPCVPESLVTMYPSMMTLRCLPGVSGSVAPKLAAAALLSALKANGSCGVYCEVRESEKNIVCMYGSVGFYDILSSTSCLAQESQYEQENEGGACNEERSDETRSDLIYFGKIL